MGGAKEKSRKKTNMRTRLSNPGGNTPASLTKRKPAGTERLSDSKKEPVKDKQKNSTHIAPNRREHENEKRLTQSPEGAKEIGGPTTTELRQQRHLPRTTHPNVAGHHSEGLLMTKKVRHLASKRSKKKRDDLKKRKTLFPLHQPKEKNTPTKGANPQKIFGACQKQKKKKRTKTDAPRGRKGGPVEERGFIPRPTPP